VARLFFALVGKTGSGKSALTELMLQRRGSILTDIASCVTREPRKSDAPGSYTYISRAEFEGLIAAGQIVQWSEYNGHLYGDKRETVEAAFASGKCIIRPLVEPSVLKFRRAGEKDGYKVIAIGIEPVGDGYKPNEPGREDEDAERAKLLRPDRTVKNRFEPGGLEAAAKELSQIISEALLNNLDLETATKIF